MKKTAMILAAAAAVALLPACSLVVDPIEGEGTLSVKVETAATKAAMSQEELRDNAIIRIYKADFSGKVREYKASGMPEAIYLPAGGYRVDAVAGEVAKDAPAVASWEQKSYSGSSEVEISAGSSTQTTVVAKVCNAVSRISFDDTISDMFEPGYSCTIGLSADDPAQQLVYDAEKAGQDGYFIVSGFEPSLFWTFTGTLRKNGSTVTRSGEIASVEAGKRYAMTLKYTEKEGIIVLDIVVDDSMNEFNDDIIFIPVSTGIAATPRYEVWAGHFTAHADVDESEYDADKVYFEYRPKGSDTWVRTSAVREAEGSYSALIGGLSGSTEYEYRLVVTPVGGGEEEMVEASSTITTEAAPQAPNSGFETTSNAESSKYKSFYDPDSPDPALQTKWWGNGNVGSTTVGASGVICYPVTDDVKEGSQAVCLQSRYVVIKFAAGNLFSGRFGELVGTSGGKVYFGRPFTARPTGLRIWMKYSSGKINRITSSAPAEVKQGDWDKASLRVALGTWDYRTYGGDAQSPVMVNTTDVSTFVDYSDDPSTIAFGELLVEADASNSTNVWKQVTIPIDYYQTNKYPTHIIISFAASMYGDYFTGYDDSRLWLDGMELLYE